MNDFIIGLVRTYVPITVGAVLSWLAVEFGVVVPDDLKSQATVFLTGLVIAVYYTAVRLLAQQWPSFERLLGVATQPTYSSDTAPPVV